MAEEEIHDLTCEQLLLHCLVFHDKRYEISQQCYPAMFHSPGNRAIFKVIKKLGEKVDIIAVEHLAVKELGKPVGTTAIYLMDSLGYSLTTLSPERLAYILKKLMFRRILLDRSKNLSTIAVKATDEDISAQINQEAEKILRLERQIIKRTKGNSVDLAKRTTEIINTDNDIVKVGVDFINRRCGGLTRRAVGAGIARPKHYKSSFSDFMASSTVKKYGTRALIISLEDPVEQRIKRVIANELDISLEDMRFKRVKVKEEDVLGVLNTTLHNNLFVVDSRDVLVPNDCIEVISDIKPDLVIVDHIQKFELDDMILGLIKAVRILETCAIRNNCHVFITSQVSDKKFEFRENQEPGPSDAQWTSALYQSASEYFSFFYEYQLVKDVFLMNRFKVNIMASRYANALGEYELQIDPDKARVLGEFEKL